MLVVIDLPDNSYETGVLKRLVQEWNEVEPRHKFQYTVDQYEGVDFSIPLCQDVIEHFCDGNESLICDIKFCKY